MAIIYNHDKRSGITYAYESKSYWDKEKKMSRSKRTLIGRVDPDTGEIVPTELFLSGLSLCHIAQKLEEEHRKTGTGRVHWTKSSVKRILRNRKYCGDVVLQNTIVENVLTKRRVRNEGQSPQYLVIDGIPAIISRLTYWLAQGEMERRGRKNAPEITTYKNHFTGKLICSCGAHYNRVNAKTQFVWKCYNRIHGKCHSPILTEGELQSVVLDAAQKLYDLKPEIKMNTIPALSEESTAEELMSAAALYVENSLRSRIADFLDGERPEKYDPALMELVEKIDPGYTVRFYDGAAITTGRRIAPVVPVKAYEPVIRKGEDETPFAVTGEPRKRLVKRLAALTGEKVTYLGFPSCAFMVGDYMVTKDGTVKGHLTKRTLRALAQSGFNDSRNLR